MSDYLCHYGVLGQKWGVRRYQPYPKGKRGTFLDDSSRRKNKRELRIQKLKNKVDKTASNARSPKDLERANKKIAKYTKKADYLRELNEPGSTKLDSKVLNRKQFKNIATAILTGQATVQNLASTGVLAATVPAMTATFGPAGLALFGSAAVSGVAGTVINGKLTVDSIRRVASIDKSLKARQTPNVDKQQTSTSSRSSQSSGTIKAKKDAAAKEGMYDVGFLDAVQNKAFYVNGDKKATLAAYDRYLEDPQKFWKDRSKYAEAD